MGETNNNRLIRAIGIVLSVVLPLTILLAICKKVELYPLGYKSWLVCDMDNQYVAYFSYFKRAILENGIFYTFSKTLGGDMLGFSAYYLFSPWNILFFFSNTHTLPMFIAWVSILKIGLCGLTCFIFLQDEKKSLGNLIFSTAYALMSYTLFYISNLMWMDAVYMLPIVALGIKKIVNEKKYHLYILSLGYTLLTNYYIGYMICIFSVLYFLYLFFFASSASGKERWKSCLYFVFGSLLAGGLNMWFLLPTKYSLDGIKDPLDWKQFLHETNFYWNDFFAKLFPNTTEDLMAGMPNVYCGIFTLMMVLLFFLNRKVTIKNKIGAAILLLVFFVSFYFKIGNIIWHGFNEPIGFPYRNSFILGFIMLCIASEGFHKLTEIHIKEKMILLVIAMMLFAAFVYMLYRKQLPLIEMDTYLFVFMVAILTLIIAFMQNEKTTWVSCLGGCILIACELYTNGVDVCNLNEGMSTTFYESYADWAEPLVDYLHSYDTSFYRLEKNFYRNINDPMMLSFAGLSHYSSTEKPNTKYFMQEAGYRNNGNFAYYNRGSTFAMDSFLGLKYILSTKMLNDPYMLVDKIESTHIYENPYSFSIASLTDGNLYAKVQDLGDKFQFQNDLFRALYLGKDLYSRQTDFEITGQNVVGLDGGYFQKINPDAEAFLQFSFVAQKDDPIYIYLATLDKKIARIFLNDEDTGKYFDIKQYDILDVNDYIAIHQGDELRIKIVLEENIIQISDVQIYYEDTAVFKEYYNYQDAGKVDLRLLSNSHIIGEFDNNENRSQLLFTIPYSEGWKIYIDGKKVDSFMVADVFMGVKDIPVGKHQVELKYVPKGFYLGLALSIASFIILVVSIILSNKKPVVPIAVCFTSIIVCIITALFGKQYQAKKPIPENFENKKYDTVHIGKIEQDGIVENGPEDIEWLVVDQKDNQVLLVAKNAVEYMTYADNSVVATWDESKVRSWLNGEFYQAAFSDEEKSRIVLTFLDNSLDDSMYISAGENTTDYVFILDRADIMRYFGVSTQIGEDRFYSEASICEATNYAQSKDRTSYELTELKYDRIYKKYGYSTDVIGKQGAEYWVRNPGLYTPLYAITAGGNGNVYKLGTNVNNLAYVRPAMWITME